MELSVATREAQLKAEYADWYPELEAGVWFPAAWVAERVLEQLRHGEPRWALSTRALADDHFAFRGGELDRPSDLRRRASDEVSLDREHTG
jgi:hypothetical protein